MAVPVPQPNPRTRPYPGGHPSSGGGSGSLPGGGGGGVTVPSSNGGVFAANQVAIYPCTNTSTGATEYRTFDVSQPPNDPIFPSSYAWKVEQFEDYRNPTVTAIIWTFTDLGRVSVTWTLTYVNEDQEVEAKSTSLSVGNLVPTGKIMTVRADILATGMNFQLSVSKAAGAGPLSIVKVKLWAAIEEGTQQ